MLLLYSAKATILCLQETKLDFIDNGLACEIAGPSRRSFSYLPAIGTRGGIALFWDASVVSVSNTVLRQFSITATVTCCQSGRAFILTSVYGPTDDGDKSTFLAEMKSCTPAVAAPGLIEGDFKMIYEAGDKSNLNICRRLMGQFRAAIDHCDLFELRCSNRKFSWSNERDQPTLVNLDRFFCNPAWLGRPLRPRCGHGSVVLPL